MAELTLEIGPLSASKTATNTKAQRVLESSFNLFHPPCDPEDPECEEYTDQEKLDWLVQILIPRMLADKAKQYEEQMAIQQAKEDLEADPPEFE